MTDPRQELADRYSRDARQAAARGDQDEAKRLRALMWALYDEMEQNPPSDFNQPHTEQAEATR